MAGKQEAFGSVSRRSFVRGSAAAAAGTAALAGMGGYSARVIAPSLAAGTAALAGMGGFGASAAQADEAMAAPSGEQGMWALQNGEDRSYFKCPEGAVAYEADPVADSQVSQTIDCDVVVAGAGISGVCTALAAAENGLSVVVLEKTAQANGRGVDIASIGSRLEAQAGVEFDKQHYIDMAMTTGHYRVSHPIYQRWTENSDAIDWYIDTLGDAVSPYYNAIGDPARATTEEGGLETWHDQIRFEGGIFAFVSACAEKMEADGATVMYECPAVQLVQDEDGRVTGVVAKNADGEYVKVNASKGVALCCGGYENNWEMMQRSLRPDDLAFGAWMKADTGATGDGILMGQALGAAVDPYPHVISRDPGGCRLTNRWASGLCLPFTRVNLTGQRFVNEAVPVVNLANAIMAQPGGTVYAILAGDLAEAIASTDYNTYSLSAASLSPEELAEQFEEAAYRGETVEELCELTGINAEGLQATMDRVTELRKLGEDEDWHCDPGMLIDFSSGPYWAIPEGGAALCTHSGLKVDEHSRVLDGRGEPIPGLFAVGNSSGCMFDDSYPHNMSGISHGRCVVFGYLLAQDLAQ